MWFALFCILVLLGLANIHRQLERLNSQLDVDRFLEEAAKRSPRPPA
jgi:hypothetical protein